MYQICLANCDTIVKKFFHQLQKKEAELNYRLAVKYIDKAVSKKFIHKNTGSRKSLKLHDL